MSFTWLSMLVSFLLLSLLCGESRLLWMKRTSSADHMRLCGGLFVCVSLYLSLPLPPSPPAVGNCPTPTLFFCDLYYLLWYWSELASLPRIYVQCGGRGCLVEFGFFSWLPPELPLRPYCVFFSNVLCTVVGSEEKHWKNVCWVMHLSSLS